MWNASDEELRDEETARRFNAVKKAMEERFGKQVINVFDKGKAAILEEQRLQQEWQAADAKLSSDPELRAMELRQNPKLKPPEMPQYTGWKSVIIAIKDSLAIPEVPDETKEVAGPDPGNKRKNTPVKRGKSPPSRLGTATGTRSPSRPPTSGSGRGASPGGHHSSGNAPAGAASVGAADAVPPPPPRRNGKPVSKAVLALGNFGATRKLGVIQVNAGEVFRVIIQVCTVFVAPVRSLLLLTQCLGSALPTSCA